ncbi:MAG TPA: hypothetical protein PLX97_02920 [Gemmatales bacterium]|nr:hypothetical protein [Gemmatales bacterium]
MAYTVEYHAAAEQRLQRLMAYLKSNVQGSIAHHAMALEERYVQRAIDQLDALLAKLPKHLGRPYDSYQATPLPLQPGDMTRVVNIGPISLIYSIAASQRLVQVWQLVYHPDRN